jgi:hypothetical protein
VKKGVRRRRQLNKLAFGQFDPVQGFALVGLG